MTTFRACAQRKRNDSNSVSYIRIDHDNKIAYIKINLLVNEKEIKKNAEIIYQIIKFSNFAFSKHCGNNLYYLFLYTTKYRHYRYFAINQMSIYFQTDI